MSKFLVIRHSICGKTMACEIEAATMREARDKARECFRINGTNRKQTTIYVISKVTKRTAIIINWAGAELIKKEERTDREWKTWNLANDLENVTTTTELHI